MILVLDSSIAVKWVLLEIDSDKAEELREAAVSGIYELHSPDVFPIEVAHALTRAERQLRISVGEAEDLWNEVMADCPRLALSVPLTPRANCLDKYPRPARRNECWSRRWPHSAQRMPRVW